MRTLKYIYKLTLRDMGRLTLPTFLIITTINCVMLVNHIQRVAEILPKHQPRADLYRDWPPIEQK